MDANRAGITAVIQKYQKDVEILVKYLPWLENNTGQKLSSNYEPEESQGRSLKVPVYDATLLNFIKTAQKTSFMNRNYVYTYSRKRLKNAQDELALIEATQIMDMQVLGDILSYYVMKGMTKSTVWTDGMQNGVLYHVVKKMKELIEFWTISM